MEEEIRKIFPYYSLPFSFSVVGTLGIQYAARQGYELWGMALYAILLNTVWSIFLLIIFVIPQGDALDIIIIGFICKIVTILGIVIFIYSELAD